MFSYSQIISYLYIKLKIIEFFIFDLFIYLTNIKFLRLYYLIMIAALSRVNMALRPASKIFFRFASLQDSNLLNASLEYQKAVLAENIIKIIQ